MNNEADVRNIPIQEVGINRIRGFDVATLNSMVYDPSQLHSDDVDYVDFNSINSDNCTYIYPKEIHHYDSGINIISFNISWNNQVEDKQKTLF